MRRQYDFVVRYENLLSDPRMATLTGDAAADAATLSGTHASPDARAGTVWTIWRSLPGVRTLSLINLTGVGDARWNAPKPTVHTLHDLDLDMLAGGRATAVHVASPDGPDQRLYASPFETHGEGAATRITLKVPKLEYWTMVFVQIDEA
jgi:hypothetical protein